MVLTGIDQLDCLVAQPNLHSLRIHNVGAAYFRKIFCGCHVSVLIAIVRSEEAFRHSANTRVCRCRTDDLFCFELTVVITVNHVAGHVRKPSVHVPKHAFLCDEARGIRENGSAFDVIPVAVAVDHITDWSSGKALIELRLEPLCKIRVEGVDKNDAVGGQQKRAVPQSILRSIKIVHDLYDLATSTALRCSDLRRKQKSEDEFHRYTFHADGLYLKRRKRRA